MDDRVERTDCAEDEGKVDVDADFDELGGNESAGGTAVEEVSDAGEDISAMGWAEFGSEVEDVRFGGEEVEECAGVASGVEDDED